MTSETTHPALAEQSRALDACIDRRNRTEAVAGGIAIVLLVVGGISTLTGEASGIGATITGLGQLLVAVGLAAALWRLRRHTELQARPTPALGLRAGLAERLRRERDLTGSALRWYIGPALPGFVLLWGGMLVSGLWLPARAGRG